MLGRELVIDVVDVATRRLRRSVPHDPLQPRKLRLRRRQVEPPECVPERVRLRLLTGMSAASMIGPTILITAVIDSCPSASGNEAVAPAPAMRGNRNGLSASSGTSSHSSRQRSSASTTSE